MVLELPLFDVWICEGRMCGALGAAALKERATAVLEGRGDGERCRVLRGGCFGLCEMSANVVVRRWATRARLPDPSVDRLVVTGRANETVYSRMRPDDLERALSCHLDHDEAAEELTLLLREADVPATSLTAKNIRRLRQRRRSTTGAKGGATP